MHAAIAQRSTAGTRSGSIRSHASDGRPGRNSCSAPSATSSPAASTRATVRVSTSAGVVLDADYQAILVLRGALTRISPANVNRLVIYNADVNGDPTRPACLTVGDLGAVGQCNVFTGAQIASVGPADFSSCGLTFTKFCPANRVRPYETRT